MHRRIYNFFVFLLLCLFLCHSDSAQAQFMVQPHHYAAGYLLDQAPGSAAAYSLRRLSSTYAGPALQVRRSSDNDEARVCFDVAEGVSLSSPVDDDLDGSCAEGDLATWVSANSAFVVVWYDQSGNARDATQATAANQPRIVNVGALDVDANGRAHLVFDGTDDILVTASTSIASAAGHTAMVVIDIDNSASPSGILRHRVNGGYGTASGLALELNAAEAYGNLLYDDGAGNALANDGTVAPTVQALISVVYSDSNVSVYHDGALADGTSTVMSGATPLGAVDGNTQLALGGNAEDSRPFLGKISEVLLWDAALTNSTRQAAENNINAYY